MIIQLLFCIYAEHLSTWREWRSLMLLHLWMESQTADLCLSRELYLSFKDLLLTSIALGLTSYALLIAIWNWRCFFWSSWSEPRMAYEIFSYNMVRVMFMGNAPCDARNTCAHIWLISRISVTCTHNWCPTSALEKLTSSPKGPWALERRRLLVKQTFWKILMSM